MSQKLIDNYSAMNKLRYRLGVNYNQQNYSEKITASTFYKKGAYSYHKSKLFTIIDFVIKDKELNNSMKSIVDGWRAHIFTKFFGEYEHTISTDNPERLITVIKQLQ